MLAFSLGVAWLLLGPLCLWLLVRGRAGERVGAVVALALLEGGTIAMSDIHPAMPPAHAVAAHVEPSCDERVPVPRSAKVGREIVLTWPAAPHECQAAEAVVRTQGRKMLVWLYEGPSIGRRVSVLTVRHQHVFTLPVRVDGGSAVLSVPMHGNPHEVLTDGRTGRRIPAHSPQAA
ncbi:hypothetical protein [Nonomuraea sp. NPDC049695]|uniref:hypothetical protein n=1 Tax=Nonomuraea sp. NPDC049695 TaxID=3154734 RepID=UPI003443F1AD